MVNPFMDIMPGLVSLIDQKPTCTEMATYIDQNPPADYKPNTLWLDQFFNDRRFFMDRLLKYAPKDWLKSFTEE
ncbi:hypothetical protein Pmar_PMAR022117 [Perkinsus marinus ATCC 50983]|uniref:Uncharacterized protein n=1 Tax=Perkinsus marinus (strain ATCC 50983 / TXsc) TaxID=423536 RepID=C5L0M8_PERM5|nr:hypothetical protein Pmar_PMAR022117 [Perkinsus marinus ATCC 50983]EER09680.1 hypothetical protein Pmar_PMAR022117 [Perkinsus marinus ATCC 50983]|eukprot:XP_002777885.1 hypothetical protein Pmar_PMAR022117 [Perkinsus marinus ATCC 50983]